MATRAAQPGVIPPTGLTVIVPHDSPQLDIVFVHGFTGHPERTWTHKRGDPHRPDDGDEEESLEPQPKSRRLNPFSSAQKVHDHAHSSVYWPRDLLPTTVPGARVLTYGYDTNIRHWAGKPIAHNTVRDIAWNCLVALEAARREAPMRPLLFVVHSLGGIVVKELVRRSSGCCAGQDHLRKVLDSTCGIVFFGTPHGGSDPRGLVHHVAERVIKAMGWQVNEDIVNSLLPSSERLQELRDEFGPIAQERSWTIHSFQEQLAVKTLGRQVVEDVSSYLNLPGIEITEFIGTNHMEMCRFTGPKDIEYKKVAAALQRLIAKIPSHRDSRPIHSLTDDQRQQLKSSLSFDQIDARHLTIKSAHPKTCTWLKSKTEFVDWLNPSKMPEHHGFLWVKGKAGTGKSTLMKFALKQARRTMKDKTIISFFFNARGEALEKSTEGMYRSLLLQVLDRHPELTFIFDTLPLIGWPQTGQMQWSVEALKDLFEQAVQALGKLQLVCFIDALDECDEDQIRDMRAFFARLGESAVASSTGFQVMLSSRPYPFGRLPFGLEFTLEGQEGHNKDLTSYIDSELKIGHSKVAEEIKAELQHKSSGIFMWVVLVVNILNKEHDRGRTRALAMRKRLQDIPADLYELFRDILTRDKRDTEELILCIQWVLFSKTPLKPEEFYYAMLAGTDSESLEPHDDSAAVRETIQRFITDSSKGLVETTKAKTPVVQFIHESVRDFLLKHDGLRKIWPNLGDCFYGKSHESLKECCLTYIAFTTDSSDSPLVSLPEEEKITAEERDATLVKFPLLQYAARNIFYHADVAEHNEISQGDFLQTFPLLDWIHLDNYMEKFKLRRHEPNLDRFLYILAEKNTAHLIKSHFATSDPLTTLYERYLCPFFAALATGSTETVLAFAELHLSGIKDGLSLSPFQLLCQSYLEDPKRIPDIGLDFSLKQPGERSGILKRDDVGFVELLLATKVLEGVNPPIYAKDLLRVAAAKGFVEVTRLLLIRQTNTEDYIRRSTPLFAAAEKGHIGVVKLLLDNGANLNAKTTSGQTPLPVAITNGHFAVVNLLLDRIVDVDEPLLSSFGNSLFRCAYRGYYDVAKKLIGMGAHIDWADESGETALWQAAGTGHVDVIEILLDNQANIDSRNTWGTTPIAIAAANGKTAAVELLLARGADVNLPNNKGDTPLSLASARRHDDIVKILQGQRK